MTFPPFRPFAKRPLSDRPFPGIALGGIALFIVGVTAGAWGTLNRIETVVRESVGRSLTTVVATAQEASHHWATRQQSQVATLAALPELVPLVEHLLTAPVSRQSALRETIRRTLDPSVRSLGLDGYWIVSDDESVISAWPGVEGGLIPEAFRPAVEKSLDGLPDLTPITGDKATSRKLIATSPIRDRRGRPIAVLVIPVPAERELPRLAAIAHSSALARAYFFDRYGRVLSVSASDSVPPSLATIVEMARAARTGRVGVNLDGYFTPRGVRMLGAWAWDVELGIGVGVEAEAGSAYHVVSTARSAILGALLLTLLLFGAVLLGVVNARRRAVMLSALQRRLAAVLESTTDPVCFADADGGAIYLNDAGFALLGRARELDDETPSLAAIAHVLLRAEGLAAASIDGTWNGETRILTPDGRELTLSQVIICHRDPAGQVEFFSTLARDITERTQLERRLSEEKERAEVTLGSIGDAVVRTDAHGVIEYLNPVAEQLLGCRSREIAGQRIANVLTLVHETTREPLENPVEICLREERVVGRANLSLLVRPDGREFAIDDSAAPVLDRDGEVIGAVLVFHDVSRARTLARQLAHQASHDFLTGLVNRHEFERRVARALVRAQSETVTHALCFLDLDQFKVVNDTCGHGAGDELLRQLAGALQKKVRRRDTLARLGGDEFGVLLEHCLPGQAARVAHDLLETVQEFRFVWEGKPFALAVSIGVVPITAESESLAAVMRDADAACYAAKERGRNRVHIYEPNDAMMALRQGEMQWVSRITSALEEQRFRLYAQVIAPLHPGKEDRARCEVLIRMVERDGTLIAPGAFIPAAERYNLMGAVDRWVVKEVAALYARQPAGRMMPITSINLSGASLDDPGMLSFVRDQLVRHRLPPEMFCFEITETAAIANLAQAAHFIRELKSVGCWFALDDFGSGMSSFTYLQTLPVDALKIAGAFLRHIESDPVEYAMVEAINRVGHVMRLKTVAEGVENLQTLETLRKIGVDYAQGFAIAEPIPLEDLLAGVTPSISRGAMLPPSTLRPAAPRSRAASV
ncbi:MAG: EAL domain-containing protein [Gemmatimonadales bacterium]